LGEASSERNQAAFLAHCDRLLDARRRRPRPERDEKIVADWNGLAIAALVQAAVVFDEPRWLEAARAAFAFVADAMTVGDTLHHAWNGGQLGAPGILDDYANMSLAALRLLEATGEARYLQQAAAWTRSCIRHFADPNGGFFHTGDNVRHLVARIRDGHDGATPSGNGIMARGLSELFLEPGEDLPEGHPARGKAALGGRPTARAARLRWAADRRLMCARDRLARCRSPTPVNWRGG